VAKRHIGHMRAAQWKKKRRRTRGTRTRTRTRIGATRSGSVCQAVLFRSKLVIHPLRCVRSTAFICPPSSAILINGLFFCAEDVIDGEDGKEKFLLELMKFFLSVDGVLIVEDTVTCLPYLLRIIFFTYSAILPVVMLVATLIRHSHSCTRLV